MSEPKPISIHIPPDLKPLIVPLRKFLDGNQVRPKYDHLVVGACIFAPSTPDHPNPRILLVQRAATERTFPNLWEVPGGSAEYSDPSILHSVARETFEETGLRLTRVVRQVGDGITFTARKNKNWIKLLFEIEVAELHGVAIEEAAERDFSNPAPVILNPEEHQNHAWVTEEELSHCTVTSGPYPPTTEAQLQGLRQAFALHDDRREWPEPSEE
ncbi:hypothetical protein MMC07_004760 [Pseudocyphellaria aurata]|nr:hypothetical protein [Pseudocyphellaria aurata]